MATTSETMAEPTEPQEHEELQAADARHLLHPWADLGNLGEENALVVQHGKGVRVRDSEGKAYLDAIGGMWCMTVGYGCDELVDAIADQARRMAYYTPFGDVSSEPAVKLAEMLAELSPGDLNRVHFTTCGSTAIDSAVRIAHYYFASQGKPEKRHIISRRNAYHESDFIHHMSSPGYDADIADISPEARLKELLDEMEALIEEVGAENIACFVAEPILASGGVLTPPPGYQQATWELCRKKDILYVSDEVVTGFGRLGHFFASEVRFGILPDMIVTAKGITSGYQPLGAVLISDRITDAIGAAAPEDKPVFSNGYTYSGHPVACAAAIKNIEIMQRDDICGHVREVGPYFMERLRELRSFPIVYAVRGDHLMACVECWTGEEKGPNAQNMALAQRVDAYCQEAGLIVRPYENLCILSPPLIVEKSDIDQIVTILEGAIDRAMKDLKAGKLD